MLKQVVLFVATSLMLIACSEQTKGFKTLSEGQQQLRNINNLILNQAEASKASVWPFSEEYLQARHLTYQGLKATQLSDSQQAQLNYLIIAQRYPERYFVWPVQRDVVKQARLQDDYSAQLLVNWLELVKSQLIAAEQSKLKLNKIELSLLHNMVKANLDHNNDDSVQAALHNLERYLADYKPRSKLGLVGLANGKDWYQSKLNYYSGVIKPPLNWLSDIQAPLTQSQEINFSFPELASHTQPLVMHYFNNSRQFAGLDWQLEFIDPLASKRKLSREELYFWLVMMETDLGIHYHTWSELQARVNLTKRLGINQQLADWLIEEIVLYPAMSFIFISELDVAL